MSGNDGTGELRVAWRGGMMRRQRLRPGTKDDEQRNEHPGRDDHSPSGCTPVVALRFGLGFETFEHTITRFVAMQQLGRPRLSDRRLAACLSCGSHCREGGNPY